MSAISDAQTAIVNAQSALSSAITSYVAVATPAGSLTANAAVDALTAQLAILGTANAQVASLLTTVTTARTWVRQGMVAAGIQEGSKNDPRPMAIRSDTFGGSNQ
jgi:hypothetical protein